MRRYFRRRKIFRWRIKKQTTYNIVAFFLFSCGCLILLSFFQSGSLLRPINFLVREKFGWGGIFLPLIFFLLSLLLLRIKTSLTQINVLLGLLLALISLLSLSQEGEIGQQIWKNFSLSISSFGAFIVLLGMFALGLMVLFNTSLEEIIKTGKIIFRQIKKIWKKIPSFSRKPTFVEKLPLSPPPLKILEKKEEKERTPSSFPSPKETHLLPLEQLGNKAITNLPTGKILPWTFPPLSLLNASGGQKADRGDMKHNAQIIEKTLESFGINAHVVEVNLGPAVTQYALEIALGTKLSKITALSNDLALALAAPTGQIRIEAPIPGRRLVGIEIPNRSLEFVTLRQMLSSEIFQKNTKDKLLVALGLDVSGNPVPANIARMPHVLIAGTTGSGKSVLINSWISSLLFRTTPNEVKLILIDPKRVELTGYNGIPHLLTPVIVEPEQILSALKWATQEMDKRYKIFAEVGVRNIDGYNEFSGFQALPYIVIFIDELADLMAFAPVEVEDSICRLAQMARATGIHLVVSTQRPSVDVITGLIKANIPCRIAFNVSSMVDSRVIIDMPGAEKLLGRGDMLYIPPDQAKPTRIQGTYVSELEVSRLVNFLKSKNLPVQYTQEVTSLPVSLKKTPNGLLTTTGIEGKDPLFLEALRIVCQHDRASASLLQRRLSIGYARAARIIDQLEAEGIVGPGEGSKPRDVLVHSPEEYLSTHPSSSPAEFSKTS